MTKAWVKLVAKVFVYLAYLTGVTIASGWVGGKLGGWIGKSIVEVME